MSKNHSLVYVTYRDGSKASGKRVVLGFSGLTGGMTSPVYTNREGAALIEHDLIEHDSTGTATVYVDGSNKGTMRCPGKTLVVL
ncbi:MAG: hypothetical protein HUU43_17240 [Ignavibacteriaceae bacterium]|nr:hypothetical protein [Ignavibacteriaceae bacterium]